MKYSFWWDHGYDDYKQVQPSLNSDLTCEWLVVGGGISGLHAALALVEAGKENIVIIEGFECGRGTTGASTGFVMPDAETSFADLVTHFGNKTAEYLWNYVEQGCNLIYDTTTSLNLPTDLEIQPTVYVGLPGKESDILEEYSALTNISTNVTLLENTELQTHVNTKGYTKALTYGNTYAMNPLLYTHHLKLYLISKGVKIYEHTKIVEVLNTYAQTDKHRISFGKAIVTINKPRRITSLLSRKIAGVQSSASISRPLTDAEVLTLFPDGIKKMVYDSQEFYLYWRLTSDNRIILGKDSFGTLLNPKASKKTKPVLDAQAEFYQHVPHLKDLRFDYYWSEIIDGTYDLIPLIFTSGNVTYSGGNVGLPWAARTGLETAQVALGKSIDPRLSKKRVPLSMFGDNPYLKIAQYAILFAFSNWVPNKNLSD